jgi:hypothetical protein
VVAGSRKDGIPEDGCFCLAFVSCIADLMVSFLRDIRGTTARDFFDHALLLTQNLGMVDLVHRIFRNLF